MISTWVCKNIHYSDPWMVVLWVKNLQNQDICTATSLAVLWQHFKHRYSFHSRRYQSQNLKQSAKQKLVSEVDSDVYSSGCTIWITRALKKSESSKVGTFFCTNMTRISSRPNACENSPLTSLLLCTAWGHSLKESLSIDLTFNPVSFCSTISLNSKPVN